MIFVDIIIEGIRTRKDNTIAISVACNELPPAKAAEIMGLHGKYAVMALKPEKFTKLEADLISESKVDETIGKTQSQRLRGVLYRLWQQDNEGYKNDRLHYDSKMDEIINHFKGKLQ
jgi:hypothetical protein